MKLPLSIRSCCVSLLLTTLLLAGCGISVEPDNPSSDRERMPALLLAQSPQAAKPTATLYTAGTETIVPLPNTTLREPEITDYLAQVDFEIAQLDYYDLVT